MSCETSIPSNQLTQPLYIHQGTDYVQAFRYKDPDGNAVNISGYTFTMTLARLKRGGTAGPVWTSADGDFTITNAAAGEFRLRVDQSEVDTLPTIEFWFDLNANDGTNVLPFVQGKIIVDEAA